MSEKKNVIAFILKIVAYIVFILGFFVGISNGIDLHGGYNTKPSFKFIITFYWWVASFISGLLLLSISEIIELLQRLVDMKYQDTSNKNNNHKNVKMPWEG